MTAINSPGYNLTPQFPTQSMGMGGMGGLTSGGSLLSMPTMPGAGLNMGPSMDSMSPGSSLLGGGMPGGMSGGGGLSQLLPQLLQIMSMVLQIMMSLLGGGQSGAGGMGQPGQDPSSQIPGGSQCPSGGGAPPTGGTAPTPTGGTAPPPTGGTAPTPTGGTAPTPTGGATPTPTGGGGATPSPITPVSGGGPTSPELSGSGKIDWSKAPDNLKKLQPYIEKASQATGTPEAIIAGTIWQESGGRVDVSATDGGSDQGLMQIDNTTYDKEVAGQNGLPHGTTPTDPGQNIMAGATYLAMMKKKFGSWDLALRGYNSGENGVDVNDPNARPAGTGDPTYVISIRQHVTNLENGTPLANR